MSDLRLDAVMKALNRACLEEYDSTWNIDVTKRFAQAAIVAMDNRGTPQQLRIEALRAATEITTAVLSGVMAREDMDEAKELLGAVDETFTRTKSLADKFLAWLSETPPHE